MSAHKTTAGGSRVPPSPDVAGGMIRVGILTEVPPVLRALGHDPDETLAEIGLDAAVLGDADNTIPFRFVGTLLEHCVKRTGCQHLGLLLGQRGGAATVGVVGLTVRNAPDLGAALRSLTQHLHSHDRGAVPTLRVSGGYALLGYAIYEPGVPACDQIYAGAIAIALQIMRELCGAHWLPAEVLFPFRKPDDLEAYRRFFQSPLRFDAGQAALAFPAGWLKHALSDTDPGLYHEARTVLGDRARTDLIDHVRRILRGMLVRGSLAEEMVAQALAMSRRTLVRRLEAEGTTFHAILQEMRLEVACQLLRDTDNPVADIAIDLGYAGASPFRRAFKQWTGFTPGEWRARGEPELPPGN